MAATLPEAYTYILCTMLLIYYAYILYTIYFAAALPEAESPIDISHQPSPRTLVTSVCARMYRVCIYIGYAYRVCIYIGYVYRVCVYIGYVYRYVYIYRVCI